MKICIPSKDRADIMRTHLQFDPKDVLIFVEPQEIEKYKFFHPKYKFINIEKNDKGVSYVRNYILNYMKDENLIMSDDDFISFSKKNKEGRYDILKNPKEVLIALEKNLNRFEACCLADIKFAYHSNKNNPQRFHINQHLLAHTYSINKQWIDKHNIRYDENLKEGEHTDFALMILINGGNIAADYLYSKEILCHFEGGFEKERKKYNKTNVINLDKIQRRHVDYLTRKYGPEFFTVSHNNYGNIKTVRIKKNLILKRLDIVKQRIENFKSRNTK